MAANKKPRVPRSKTFVFASSSRVKQKRVKQRKSASPRINALASPKYTTPKFQKTRSNAFEFVPLSGKKKNYKNVKSRYYKDLAQLDDIKNVLDQPDDKNISQKLIENREIKNSIDPISNHKESMLVSIIFIVIKIIIVIALLIIISMTNKEYLISILIGFLTEIGILPKPLTLSESILNSFGLYREPFVIDRIYATLLSNVTAQITFILMVLMTVMAIIMVIRKITFYDKVNDSNKIINVNDENDQISDELRRLSTPKGISPQFFHSLSNETE